MRHLLRLAAFTLATIASSGVGAAPVPAAASLPGPDGGWDYTSVDPAARRLYVARSTSVTLFDLAKGGAARSIGQIDHGHGVVPLPDHRSLLVTSGHDNSVRILDAEDGHEIARIAAGDGPDAALFDAASGRAYVMNHKGGTVSVIDVNGRKLVDTVALKPGLEFGVMAPDGTLYVNNEDANEIEAVDTHTDKAGAAIALTGCEGPTGLAYEARSGRLLAACANGKAAVVDARARKLVALVDIGAGPDAVILDAAKRRAFIPCGRSGELDMLALDGASVRLVKRIPTEVGARTGALDPRDGAIYLPTARFSPPATPGQRPSPLAGTFHVLVVRPH